MIVTEQIYSDYQRNVAKNNKKVFVKKNLRIQLDDLRFIDLYDGEEQYLIICLSKIIARNSHSKLNQWQITVSILNL